MKRFIVTLPIAAQITVEVEAEDEHKAVEMAKLDANLNDVDEWDIMDRVNQGNVCYFPFAWEIDVEEIGDVDEE